MIEIIKKDAKVRIIKPDSKNYNMTGTYWNNLICNSHIIYMDDDLGLFIYDRDDFEIIPDNEMSVELI